MSKKLFALTFTVATVIFLVTLVCVTYGMLQICTVGEFFENMLAPIILSLMLLLIFTALITQAVSNSIIRKINEIDIENPLNNSFDEIKPFLNRLDMQKKQMQKKLKMAERTNEEFKVITDNMSEGFMIIDCNMNLLTCNRFAKNLLGIEKNEELSFHKLKQIDGFSKAIKTALSGKRADEEIHFNENYYSLIAHPVLRNGIVKGVVAVILDITETVERELLRSEFTSNVSHELKTPLTSVSGFAEIMKDGTTPPEVVRDFSQSIYDEAQRLITLVNDIIKISELDEHSVHFKEEKVDLYKLSAEVIERLKPEAKKRNITFSLFGERAVIVGVRKILDEMIHNLCDNAIKYNKENGKIDVSIFWEDSLIKVIVKDTGIGIPKSSQSRVFERFYRVDKSHSKAIGGTGLGLSIVKHGAMYHNARIELESVEGESTTITLIFDTDK